MSNQDDERFVMCIRCRKQYSDAECEANLLSVCPNCGAQGVPADLRKQVTITITHQELKLLTFWAQRWGDDVSRGNNPINSIVKALREKHPELPPLILDEELSSIVSELPKVNVSVRLDDGWRKYRDGKWVRANDK